MMLPRRLFGFGAAVLSVGLLAPMVGTRPVTSLDVPPGATVKSDPGGLHVMLTGLLHPLMPGTDFPLSLHFRGAGVIQVTVVVAARG
jgi:copper(I)-binding protein